MYREDDHQAGCEGGKRPDGISKAVGLLRLKAIPQKISFQKTNKLVHPLGKEMTRFIVVLGTTSHSGKSTIVAALCGILKNRVLAVAPFKSQNMSLNSWVTSEGREMGIAQAVQAEAAGVEPTELMNPSYI